MSDVDVQKQAAEAALLARKQAAKAALSQEKLLDVYEVFADEIEKENTLVHQRVTWGTSVNGGLFVILGLVFGGGKHDFPVDEAEFLLLLFALSGAVASYQTVIGTRAAAKQLIRLKKTYVAGWHDAFALLDIPPPFGCDFDKDDKPVVDERRYWYPEWLFLGATFLWVVFAGVAIHFLNPDAPPKKSWNFEVKIEAN